MIEDVTAVIVCGGKSTRMGVDKATLSFRNTTLLNNAVETLRRIFKRVVLSVRSTDAFPEIKLKKIPDRFPDTGPIGGITSVLQEVSERIFVAACDMPFLNTALIQYLCSFNDYQAVIPSWKGRYEVLHAMYHASILPSLERAIGDEKYRIIDALKNVKIRYLIESEIRLFDPMGRSFLNVNTPAEYRALKVVAEHLP